MVRCVVTAKETSVAATDTQATIEKLLEVVFSMRAVQG
jgi:hypothetical protein